MVVMLVVIFSCTERIFGEMEWFERMADVAWKRERERERAVSPAVAE